MSESRGKWGSSLGFILASAGSAVGLGNLWKFPYLAGKNGGGAFVLVYLSLIIILGFTLILGEMAVGRRGKSDAYGSYKNIKKNWGFAGILAIITCFVILSYYSVIGGWVIKYIGDFLMGGVKGDVGTHFGGFISSTASPIIYALIFLILSAVIVLKGISGGIEKASKIMMPTLLVFMIIIAIRSLTLPGAMAGVEFFLKPDFSQITGKVILAALGQVFFSLSLGMGAMITYGSYLPDDSKMVRNAFIIPGLDTIVALLAGLAIMPAVFSFGMEPSAGPSLIFVTIPKIFDSMAGGTFFGIIFFVLVFFAALTSAISLLEVTVAFIVDQFKLDRKITVWTMTTLLFAFAIPNSLSFGIWEKSTAFFGMNFFDFMVYLSDNLFLPLGGLLLCLFIGYVWGEKEALHEVTNQNTEVFPLGKIWMFAIKYVGPIVIGVILLQALGILKL